ncbi:uncharacterized protein LOC132277714 [Cornus florida]|uniref:uncharacterized protein LOC132277714 n=1 Tax=Cornus florida TaxID=4283 RepID=UPI0028A017D9|nr:uncharacterized protein LOC132277714 [Cornus florida]
MTAEIRILAYGISADLCDECIKVGERTAIESLKRFCDAVIALYMEQYLRLPNESDIARLLQEGEEKEFPVDNFDSNHPHATTEKEKLFAQRQEVIRKDVERAFGVLQIRWAITHGPVYYWKKEDLSKIMRTCIILHNMIIEDEGDTNILEWTPPMDELVYLPQYNRDRSFLAAHISTRLSRIRNVENNGDLKRDLMEHLWNKFDNEEVLTIILSKLYFFILYVCDE